MHGWLIDLTHSHTNNFLPKALRKSYSDFVMRAFATKQLTFANKMINRMHIHVEHYNEQKILVYRNLNFLFAFLHFMWRASSCDGKNLDSKQFTHIANRTQKTMIKLILTRTFRHSCREDPAGGQELPSRRSCCRKVPSSLALQTTFGLPTSTYRRHIKCERKKHGWVPRI